MAGPDAKTDSEVPVGGETNSGVGDDTKPNVDAKVDASTVAGVVGRVTASTEEKTDIENNTNTDAEVKAEVPSKSDTAVVEDKTDVDSKADASKAAVATTTDEVVEPVVGEKAEKTADREPPAEGDAAISDDPWAVDIEPPATAAEPAATSVPPAATHGVDGGEGGKDGEEGDVDIMAVDSSAPVAGGGASIQGKDVPAPPAGAVYLGRLARKSFGGVPYLGRVFHYDREENWYKVRYEDGDAEDLEVPEVEKLLLSGEEETAANADIETWSEANKATTGNGNYPGDDADGLGAGDWGGGGMMGGGEGWMMGAHGALGRGNGVAEAVVPGPGAKVVGKNVLKDFEGVLTEGKITAFDEDTKKYTVEYEGTEHSLLEVLVWKGVESILVIGEDNYMPEEDMEEEEEVIEEGDKAGEKVVSVIETQEPRAGLGGALGVTEAAAPQVETAAPQAEIAAAQVETAAPQVEATVPQAETVGPQVEAAAPQAEAAAPQVDTTVLQVETTAPQVETTTPQEELTVSQMEVTASQMELSASQIDMAFEATRMEGMEVHDQQATDMDGTVLSHNEAAHMEVTESQIDAAHMEVTESQIDVTVSQFEVTASQIEVANAVMEEMGMDEATVVVATGTTSEAPVQVPDQVSVQVPAEAPQRMEEMGMDEAVIVATGTEGGEGKAAVVEGVPAAAEAEPAAVEFAEAGLPQAETAVVAEGVAD
ncbi:unnamed protein product [Closterium sp. Naga37s-1]|nr:unnamed protein product [Closterium sp. Naga37s-1]